MSEVTQVLDALARGETARAEELLPLVYQELRRLAARNMAGEKPGQTLDATGLVHEAYLRLVGQETPQKFEGRGHFYAAAAEAMRRILVEQARRKNRIKHGGGRERVELADAPAASTADEDLIAIDEALDALTQVDAQAAQVVKLHFFAGLTMEAVADVLGISVRTAHRNWAFARAWLYDCIQ
jgi:RNA polymerase sigma factor (TIGR02999 family)